MPTPVFVGFAKAATSAAGSAMSTSRVRREKAALSCGCESPPGDRSNPEATGAVMEVTKWLKPSV
jgi:hypothetical protein